MRVESAWKCSRTHARTHAQGAAVEILLRKVTRRERARSRNYSAIISSRRGGGGGMRERGRGRREEGGGGGRGEEGEREGGRFFTSRSPTRATRGLTGGHLAGARTSSAFPTPRHAKRSSTDVGDVAFRAFESRCNREPLSRRNEAEIAPQHPARRDDCRHTSQRRYHQKDGSLSPSLSLSLSPSLPLSVSWSVFLFSFDAHLLRPVVIRSRQRAIARWKEKRKTRRSIDQHPLSRSYALNLDESEKS